MMRPRRGVTLVEMLVATAVVLFVMAVLSEALVAGLESFRRLKAVGDLNVQLRGTAQLLRNDLRHDHFGDKPLSQIDLPPAQGFFRVFQGTPPTYEGSDPDGIPSYRSVDHVLHFTINLGKVVDGVGLLNPRDRYLSEPLPGSPLANQGPAAFQDGTSYLAQWAEVAYFLRPNGTSTPAGPGTPAVPLYTLYRRQRLLYVPAPGLGDLNLFNRISSGLRDQYVNVSCQPDPLNLGWLHLNSPADATLPTNRLGGAPGGVISSGGLLNLGVLQNGVIPTLRDETPLAEFWDADVVLGDVVSFDVRLAQSGGDFTDLYDPGLQALIQNPAYQGPDAPRVFDTWSRVKDSLFDLSLWDVPGTLNSLPLNIKVGAVQVQIRVWDRRSQTTRQVTIVQDM
jgi:prepilin-type N-terminal cleavage/methylation domain-containing protein